MVRKIIKEKILPIKENKKISYPLFLLENKEIKNLKDFGTDLDEFSYILEIYVSEANKFNFSFTVSSSSYCCGFLELGCFEMPFYKSIEKSNALQKLLDSIGKNSKFQLFICSIEEQIILEDCLTICKYWKKIKTLLVFSVNQ